MPQAYAGLADSYALAGDWKYGVLAPKEAYPKAKAAATKALELDSTLGEAHISLAFCLDGFDWDWESAGGSSREESSLAPATRPVTSGMPGIWPRWGEMTKLFAEVKKAASLDPLSLHHQRRSGRRTTHRASL